MGDDKSRPRRDSGKLLELRPRRETPLETLCWRLIPPQGEESCRWATADGRWIALALGQDAELGRVILSDSNGRRAVVDSYEAALHEAKRWRND